MIQPVETVNIKNIKTKNEFEVFYARFGNLIHFGSDKDKQQAFEKFKASASVERKENGSDYCGL